MTSRGQRGDTLVPVGPVFLVDRFPALHAELMGLLRGLAPGDWSKPTACALWSVRDIAAHLLDTALRRLSLGRDGWNPAPGQAISTYADLVAYLNRLNADWIAATRRLSPRVLMDFLDVAAPQVHAYFRFLSPEARAGFGVAWAGEESSPVWFDIGREYTERWLHQQQIREAVGAPGLTSREWLGPALDIFVRALPFTYRAVEAERGLGVCVEIGGEAGGVWSLVRDPDGWSLFAGADGNATTRVSLDQDAAWRLFSKGLSPADARQRVRIGGDRRLGEPLLGALAVMA
jgi:uncharacterized protein (TIGR03083 family)